MPNTIDSAWRPYEDAVKGMVGAGISNSVAEGYAELNKSINDGLVGRNVTRTAFTSTPTTIEEFALDFARAYPA
ncbi:MAG: hypothetical protein M3Y08_03410 [Fibrobacterota bacterium]|nr:hypothetical protein [Fibrobacterota bacterium]